MNSSTSSRPTAPEKPENGASVGKLDGGQVPLTPGLAVLEKPFPDWKTKGVNL
jgi:hypothetical protein